jgi:hypothetical protein
MNRLTKEQAAILGAYTNILCGEFADMHRYIEKILGRSVMTHEMAHPLVVQEITDKSHADFMALAAPTEKNP